MFVLTSLLHDDAFTAKCSGMYSPHAVRKLLVLPSFVTTVVKPPMVTVHVNPIALTVMVIIHLLQRHVLDISQKKISCQLWFETTSLSHKPAKKLALFSSRPFPLLLMFLARRQYVLLPHKQSLNTKTLPKPNLHQY